MSEDRPRQLTIRTERGEGDRVQLSVQDAGTGFEPESMNRLFEAFYTTKSDGMGMGLSVSRSIIENQLPASFDSLYIALFMIRGSPFLN